jgi:hypothetical protein
MQNARARAACPNTRVAPCPDYFVHVSWKNMSRNRILTTPPRTRGREPAHALELERPPRCKHRRTPPINSALLSQATRTTLVTTSPHLPSPAPSPPTRTGEQLSRSGPSPRCAKSREITDTALAVPSSGSLGDSGEAGRPAARTVEPARTATPAATPGRPCLCRLGSPPSLLRRRPGPPEYHGPPGPVDSDVRVRSERRRGGRGGGGPGPQEGREPKTDAESCPGPIPDCSGPGRQLEHDSDGTP